MLELSQSGLAAVPMLTLCSAGTFGRVLECWDRKKEDYVAIKIVRNMDKYRHAAMIEVSRFRWRGMGGYVTVMDYCRCRSALRASATMTHNFPIPWCYSYAAGSA